jgi:hypothetical protein
MPDEASYKADFLIRVGRINEAIDELASARHLNSLDPNVAALLAFALTSAGRIDDAVDEYIRRDAILSQDTVDIGAPEQFAGATPLLATRLHVALASGDESLIRESLGARPESEACL